MGVRLHLATSIDTLHSKSITLGLNAEKTFFNCPRVQEYYFLTFKNNICKQF